MQPSVVNVQTDREYFIRDWGREHFLERFARDFIEENFPERIKLKFQGVGSGVIVDSSGLVLTNAHVIDSAQNIKIITYDNRSFNAKLLGKNTKEDLAVLQIEGQGPFSPVDFGDSDQVQQGEDVFAIGSPYGYSQSVTRGIVSATRREIKQGDKVIYKDLIQTDAAINPGNSGGPLLNAEGRMVGLINCSDWRARSIGFAIPVNYARELLPGLKTQAERSMKFSGLQERFGFLLEESQNEDGFEQLLIAGVIPRSAADKAELKTGDVLLTFNKKAVDSMEELRDEAGKIAPGTNVYLTLERNKRVYFTYLKAK